MLSNPRREMRWRPTVREGTRHFVLMRELSVARLKRCLNVECRALPRYAAVCVFRKERRFLRTSARGGV